MPLGASIRRINRLNDATRPLALAFLQKASEWLSTTDKWRGYSVEVSDGKRDIYEQAGLYSVGRRYIHHSGWTVIGPTVTNTIDKSHHLSGDAFDVALYKDGVWEWPDDDALWLKLAEIAESIGLYAGARWKKPDRPHFSRLPA